MNEFAAEVLVVGGGTGGTAAAIQAARRGAQTILVSEFDWLGGMLTAAGVSAPDGNELLTLQTGLWGAFLAALRQRQPGGLDHGWVSFFTYEPKVGAAIFADWVKALPNLQWIAGATPQDVLRQGDRILGVQFEQFTVRAEVVIDGTELGDLMPIGGVPYRWGWDWQPDWQEPSAPSKPTDLTQRYPVQSPTWVVVMQDFGEGNSAPEIPAPPLDQPAQFAGAWDGYRSKTHVLDYGHLPGDRFMINWPQCGNDYGVDLDRLVQSPEKRSQFHREAYWHSQSFARFIQAQMGRRYGLAVDTFPERALQSDLASAMESPMGGGAFALYPYYRESRRLVGLTTVIEPAILPLADGQVAALPTDAYGQITAIAVGNYANDHHYPGDSLPLHPKSIRWGGRWTGTPFAMPYGCLIPAEVDGLLVCDKNSSVSHMANGATRLQPVVLGLGQAAGMAAALCVERRCQPRDLPVRILQEALLTDAIAPSALVPLFNVAPQHPDWLTWQRYYLDHPEQYPRSGYATAPKKTPGQIAQAVTQKGEVELPTGANMDTQKEEAILPARDCTSTDSTASTTQTFTGHFQRQGEQDYRFTVTTPEALSGQCFNLVTLSAWVDQQLQQLSHSQTLHFEGRLNPSGAWILVDRIEAQ